MKTGIMMIAALALAVPARAQEPVPAPPGGRSAVDQQLQLKSLTDTLRTGATAALRVQAAKELGRMGAEAAPALKAGLADPVNRVRVESARSLLTIDAAVPAEVAPALTPVLQDTDKALRRQTTDVLLRLGFADAASRSVLVSALSHEEAEIRLKVIGALWKSRLKGDEPYLDELLTAAVTRATTDKDHRVRRIAVVGMRSLRPTPPRISQALLQMLADPDLEMAGTAAGTIDALPDEAMAEAASKKVVEWLKTGAPAERVRAAALLSDLTGAREAATPLLKKALESDPDANVRAAAAETMGAMDPEVMVDLLVKALQTDASPKVKAAASVALSRFHPTLLGEKIETVLAALDAAAKSPDESVKAAASMAALALRE